MRALKPELIEWILREFNPSWHSRILRFCANLPEAHYAVFPVPAGKEQLYYKIVEKLGMSEVQFDSKSHRIRARVGEFLNRGTLPVSWKPAPAATPTTTPASAPASNPVTAEAQKTFNSIWHIWGKKLGKTQAIEAYKKALREGYTPQQILEGAQNFMGSTLAPEYASDVKYMPSLATFIAERSFLDEFPRRKTTAEVAREASQWVAQQMAEGKKRKEEEQKRKEEARAARLEEERRNNPRFNPELMKAAQEAYEERIRIRKEGIAMVRKAQEEARKKKQALEAQKKAANNAISEYGLPLSARIRAAESSRPEEGRV